MNSFLKTSLRHLWQSRLYSIINIVGLATAGTCMLLAVLYWKDERSYDNFHKNNPYLYRIVTNSIEKDGKPHTTGGTGQVQGPAFKAGVPEIKSYARVLGGDIYSNVIADNKAFSIQPLFVDHDFLDVFSFQLISGNPKTVLSNISAVVLTESTAKKFFNSTDVVGKMLSMDADPSFEKLGKPLIISGVVKDPPKNSSLQFDALFTFEFMHLSFEDTNWLNSYLGTFVVLYPGANIHAILKKFNKIYSLHAKEQLGDKNFDIYGYDPQISYGLQPITDIHLNSLMSSTGFSESGIINGSNPVYSYMFMGIALFILLMAAINFINISIANSFKRAKEIGVRKISGASRWQIIIQLINESAILCVIAFLISLVLMQISLPVFNGLSGKQLLFADVLDWKLSSYFIIVLALTVLLTGLYPAYILSNFKPAEVLYNKQKLSGKNLFGRSLVVLQFSLAIFLLIATIVYYSQMNFIRTKDLGYNPNQVIRTAVGGDRDYKSVISFLKNEMAKEPSISVVSFGNEGYAEEMQVNSRSFKAVYKNIDEHFLPALEIPLKAGRNLSTAFAGDTRDGIIVNEAFVKAARVQEPLGKQVKIKTDWGNDSSIKTIQGVVKDFHFGSLREPIKPMVMYMKEWPDGDMWVKFAKPKQKEAMAALERVYEKAMPNAIYQYNFLDELNAKQYIQEQRWQQVINVATFLSFIICCMGLFSLAHLSANQRTKEIGIRKVLGASVKALAALLSKDFLQLVLISCAVAFPVAWLVMNNWLRDYAYRVALSWWIFLGAGVAAMVIALATVSFQAIKAAIADPVKNLRSE